MCCLVYVRYPCHWLWPWASRHHIPATGCCCSIHWFPPHTHIVTVSLYLRLHPPDYSNNARLSRLLGLEFTSTCCACCGAGVRLGRLEELQGGAPSHRARIAGRTHTRCCAQLRVKLLPYSHWCTCLCTTQCSHVQCNSISCVQLTNVHMVEAVGPTVLVSSPIYNTRGS